MKRCDWANKHPLETQYHDDEWGVPVYDDRLLFEILTLESAQSGLSWLTILQKRKGYQEAFCHFNIAQVAQYSEHKKAQLLLDKNIVRHKLKINATVNNAQCVLAIQQEYGSFSEYLWSFVNRKPLINHWENSNDVPSSSPESDAMSKGLKQKGFKFIGTTTCYAFMQAVGMVNDHLTCCFKYPKTEKVER